MTNEEDVGTDSMRSVCLIKRVENPSVLSQHRSIRQGDAAGVSPSSSSVVVEGASGKVMHEGAVRVMAEGASGRTLPVPGGRPVEEWSWPERARPQRRKAEGGRSKEYTGFSLTGRKLAERMTTRTPCRSDTIADGL